MSPLKQESCYIMCPEEQGNTPRQLALLSSPPQPRPHHAGTVPTPPPSLSSFLLEGNKFSATLPSSLSAQTALRSLWASRNKISGELPAGEGADNTSLVI